MTPAPTTLPRTVAVLGSLFLLGLAAFAENIDPANDGSQFAWAENVGWINAEPNNCGECGVEVTSTGLTGWMWSENIGWISTSCENTNSCVAQPYGVTNDGSGNLAGYAWSENAGWVSFSCDNTTSCANALYGVTIDPQTGEFGGYAWAENIGWICFADDDPVAYVVRTDWVAGICGDGEVNLSGETCDPPGAPSGELDECRLDCTYCGDGLLDPVETCDDGNNQDSDGCAANCLEECADQDGDAYGLSGSVACGGGPVADCDDTNANAWATPSEVGTVRFPGDSPTTKSLIGWEIGVVPGGDVAYDVLRSSNPANFVNPDVVCCLAREVLTTTAIDTDVPHEGGVYYYLVRAENACPDGQGTLGTSSSGSPRFGFDCPGPGSVTCDEWALELSEPVLRAHGE